MTTYIAKETFHIHLVHEATGGRQRTVHMAVDHDAAREYGESICAERPGWTVRTVKRAPTTPVDNLARKGR